MSTPEDDNGRSLQSAGSVDLGEFTKANGQRRQCRVLWKTRRGLLKVTYVERGQTLVGYISPEEFRPDSPNNEVTDQRGAGSVQ